MALPLVQDFEEASGTGVTVTTGNSGGGPGSSSAFDAMDVTAGASVTYSSVQAAHGTYSMLCKTGTTAGTAYAEWAASIGGGKTTLYGRAYVWMTANVPSGGSRLVQFYSSGAYLGGIAFNSSSTTLAIQNAANTYVQTFTSAIPAGQWVRIEWAYTFGNSGSATVNLYTSADGTSITEGHTVTGQNFGTSGATCSFFDVGWTYSVANQPALYLDCLNLNATALPGPYAGAVQAAAALTGSGSFGTPLLGRFGGSAAWTGTGTMSSSWAFAETAGLSGSGTFTSIGGAQVSGQLTGSGTMGAPRTVTWAEAAGLSGSGTLGAGYLAAQWTGTGTLGVSGLLLGFPAGLSGTGSLGVLKVLGGLVAASSPATVASAYPGTSQVAVAAPGSSNWIYLGTVGQVTALTYSYVCPGGADSMTCTVMVPASYRTQAFNPGWSVRITRGGHQVWSGKLDEPVPTASGWNLTAVGTGNRGTDFLAVYPASPAWPAGQPDASVNAAIARGLPWFNPGIGQPSGMWFGQAVDSGAQTITALLNLICTRGAYTWYVNSQPGGYPGDDLSVFPLPSVVNRLLVCNDPVPRTLGGDINTIWIRYQVSADTTSGSTSVPAVFALTSVVNAASVAAHGTLEAYLDISDAGTATLGAAQAVGSSVLQLYTRASFAGPFTASYGQLLNAGGVSIDPATDQAGTVVRLLLGDWAMGGEVTSFPVEFIVGSYSYDDFAQVATIVPFQSVDSSLSGLLSLSNTLITPLTAAGLCA